MDEEMEDMIEYTYTAVQIDLDYEFDAARHFDFSREESLPEARGAELWFQAAPSYPPSPFVTNLIPREHILLENVNTSPKTKDVDNATLPCIESDIELNPDVSVMDVNSRGLTFYNHVMKDKVKPTTTLFVKQSFPRTSTLMKPTASQLAKQNRTRQVGNSRFQKVVENNKKSSDNPCGNETQAAKRQKLEGGHFCKDGHIEEKSLQPKLRLTIPREPDLETALRAQRMRPKISGEAEHVMSAVPKFKALPLNKKILAAPSFLIPKRITPRLPEFQEFHLKTSERATQHSSAVSSTSDSHKHMDKALHKPSANSIAECGNKESRRANLMDAPKQEGCEKNHYFKARPLNRKIFSSKGDIGVFRNLKRETTVPMEFNFQTEKRVQHDPTVELFNKLSLKSELQPNAGCQLKFSRPTCIPAKGSKENRLGSFNQGRQVKHLEKETPSRFGVKKIPQGNNGEITASGPPCGMSRGLGIR
ncbi:unnamed protein product [Ilex paraguariensis]|uniref:TPX2 central domain-containing protein n=1 Tax=Ilex paraguariensis TaxID=185542 RepID=A0ABC8QZ17_9AQUA